MHAFFWNFIQHFYMKKLNRITLNSKIKICLPQNLYGVLLDDGAVVTHRRCIVVAKFHLSCKISCHLQFCWPKLLLYSLYQWYDIRSGLERALEKKQVLPQATISRESIVRGQHQFKKGTSGDQLRYV